MDQFSSVIPFWKPQKVKKFDKFSNCQTIGKVTGHARGDGEKTINLPPPYCLVV